MSRTSQGMGIWENSVYRSLEERAETWEVLATGSTSEQRDIAAVLRSIVGDIEGPHPADWKDIREALEYCLAFAQKRTGEADMRTLWEEMSRTDSANTDSPDGEFWVVQ